MRFGAALFLLCLVPLAACEKRADAEAPQKPAPVFEREVTDMRLYVFDCGHFGVADMGRFDSSGALDGKPGELVNACFLVRHPKGDLMWEAGIDDKIHDAPDGVTIDGFHMTLPKTLEGQLERIGAPPAAVEYFAISDFNADHTGNANLFKRSTFIVNSAARAAMFSDEAKKNAPAFASYADLEAAKKAAFSDSYDVFGDGSVIIISAPGPKAGHSVLFVNLPHSGPLLLSGDLYFNREGRKSSAVPRFNEDADATRQSFETFEKIADEGAARVIIEHDVDDFENLPRAPAYLD